ncbi:hypothetical protein FRB90_008307 [Tulasnella sp. 427]|nr:hypothetical protein FRB90_008307 [Tulasnella sp. 427]
MDKLLQHIHRWETLEVSEADEKTVAQLRRHTAPALNALKLSSTSAVFLELSLDSFAPNVRAVHIRDSGLRWKTSNLSGLQELSLLDIASGMPDVDTLIDILSQSPELTRLRVEQTMLRRTQRQARNPITLSHLRTLSLGHLGRDVIAQLLKSIVIPSTTECHFSISLNDYEDTSVWEQVDPIGQRFLALAAVSRGIQSTLRFSKEHAGWALGLVYEGKAEGHGRLSAEVEVLAGNTLGMAELFAQQISQGEPNPCPPVLRVVDLISDLELLPRLHGHLPHTEEIHIEDDNPHLVTRALDAIFTPHPSSRLFPSLSTLTIQNPRPNEWADWLIKRQKRQYKRGGVDPLPLATLKIQGGNLTAENMKWMRKLVGNVGVDNEQMP